MRIKTGDTVKVLYGKDSGKTGKVVKVLPRSEEVVVEGMNQYKRHVKGDGRTKVSEIINITKPMPVAKVQLVDPDTGKPTRVGYKVDGGKKVRVSKKTGKEIGVTVEKAKKETKKEDKKKPAKKKETKSKTSKK